MKASNLLRSMLFTISILLVACNKEENPPISQGNMWNCHREVTWDTLSLKENLIGAWDWQYIGCFWNPEEANDDEFKGLTIEFKANNTLDVRVNGQVTQTSDWKVVYVDADLMTLNVEPGVAQLNGLILFCEEWLEFNDGYIDGCNNYFKRKE